MAHFLAREGNLCVCERYLHVPAAHLHVDERRKHVCDGKVKGKGKPLRRAGESPLLWITLLPLIGRKPLQTRFPEFSLDLTACEIR